MSAGMSIDAAAFERRRDEHLLRAKARFAVAVTDDIDA